MDTNAQPDAPVQTPAQPAASGFPDLSSTPASPDAAKSALETLRQDRLAGRVDQQHYVDRAEYLQKVIAGEQVQAVDLYGITTEQKLEQQYQEHMAAPTELHAYGQLPAMSLDGDQAAELDTAARTAFAKAGIPAHLGAPLIEAANRISLEIYPEGASVNEQEAVSRISGKLSSTESALRTQWGDRYQAQFDGVVDLVCELAAADPTLGEIIDSAPWLVFGSEPAMDYLSRVAQHRRRSR